MKDLKNSETGLPEDTGLPEELADCGRFVCQKSLCGISRSAMARPRPAGRDNVKWRLAVNFAGGLIKLLS